MTSTARLALPLIEPGQAQKEMFHNEALTTIDVALHASVVAAGLDTPPVMPEPGASWIVGAAPGGAWAGQAGTLASWTEGGWRFVRPRAGMAVWNIQDAVIMRFVGGDWERGIVRGGALHLDGRQVVGPQRAAIAAPGGGATVDAEARATIAAMLATLRAHGLIAS